ncbi:acyl-CoA thioesterase [Paenarthrobacter nicotinovorans]|uniref:acyl-CoA thioesterase n=1 Tax=Paenarthrobacter nicotinovorans TaxID=29320 RepID=UPI0027D892FF|nr:thioesterase family protein [Paenarthrobacter nicotinovorans]
MVEWADTDAAGHHHNSAIVRWVEAAEAELMRELGIPDYFPVAPRVQQLLNFRGKLWFGQQVIASVWVERVGTSSLTLGFDVVGRPCDRSAGGKAADGTITTVHVPPCSTVSAPWPEKMRYALTGGTP